MERLTKRTEYGIVANNDKVIDYPLYKIAEYDELDHGIVGACFEKLAEYEDLEEQGLLLKLPCKVGDTVWCIFEGNVYEAIAQKVTIVTGLDNYQLIKIEAEFNIIDPYYNDGRTIKYGIYQNYLETVFLTQAEAEQKLKEMERC